MEKKMYIFILISFLIPKLYSQNWGVDSAYYVDNLPVCLQSAWNYLELKSKECIFYALGHDYFGEIDFLTSNDIYVSIIPYQKNDIEHFLQPFFDNGPSRDRAFTIINGHLILLKFYNQDNSVPIEYDSIRSFIYPLFDYDFGPNLGSDQLTMLIEYDGNNCHTKSEFLQTSQQVYVYPVQENDTWESIESIIKVPLAAEYADDMKTKKALKRSPHKGMNIVIAYSYQDKKLSARYFRISQ